MTILRNLSVPWVLRSLHVGCWEHKLFQSLNEVQEHCLVYGFPGVLSLSRWRFILSLWSFVPSCTHVHSKSQGIPSADLWVSLSVQLHFLQYSALKILESSACWPPISNTNPMRHLGSLSLCCSLELPTGSKLGQLWGTLELFTFSQESQCWLACCPVSENNYFIYFIQFSDCCGGRVVLIIANPTWPGGEVSHLYFNLYFPDCCIIFITYLFAIWVSSSVNCLSISFTLLFYWVVFSFT